MAPWDRRNSAGQRDTLQADLTHLYREAYEALKPKVMSLCHGADADITVDREAFEIFADSMDSAFDIDWRSNDENQ